MIINRKNQSKLISLFCFLLLCFFIEFIGGLFTNTSVNTWYQTLDKASWTPAPWVFGPVWTVLYILIAVSGWLVFCKETTKKKTRAFFVYSLQLFLNLLWTYLFFYLKSPLLGLVEIIVLSAIIIWNMTLFWEISRRSSFLLLPYLLWIMYAISLNAAIYFLN